MTRCGDWLISAPELRTKTEVEPFGFSLWSQRKTDPTSEMTHAVYTAGKCTVNAESSVVGRRLLQQQQQRIQRQ